MVCQRLQKGLWNCGFSSFGDYYDYVTRDSSGQALHTLGNLITTNHTYFFREKAHFDYLKNHALPRLVVALGKRGEKELRIWCTGCSSGEEPYSMAMIISEFIREHSPGIDFYILATDSAATALKKAVAGIYTKDQVSRVPPIYKLRYYEKMNNGTWRVDQKIKDDSFPSLKSDAAGIPI